MSRKRQVFNTDFKLQVVKMIKEQGFGQSLTAERSGYSS